MIAKNIKHQDDLILDVEDTDIAHLAGFLDAVGTVTVHISKNDRYRIGYQYKAVVRVLRPVDDTDPILGKLMEYSEDNGVRYSINEVSHGGGVKSKSYAFEISDPDSIEQFLKPMFPYLVSQYEKTIIMIEQILPRMRDDLHTEKEGFIELMEFADILRQDNPKGGDVEYTKKYFEDLWSIPE